MKWFIAILCTLCAFHNALTLSTRRVPDIDFYEEAKQENLSSEDIELLKPIIDNLSAQYQFISTATANEDIDITTENNIKTLFLSTLENVSAEDDYPSTPFSYDTRLPSLNNFKGSSLGGSSAEEIRDMEKILQESIDDAQVTVQDIVLRSNEIEAMLISINKIKILKFIYKMMGNVFSLGARVARTAYCTYSSIPLINSTISNGKAIGICYTESRDSIKELRTNIQSSINTIRTSVLEIIEIYKKIAGRESLLGKLLTLLMNVSKVQNDIKQSRESAYQTIDHVKTEVPAKITASKECATASISTFVHELNETVTRLTQCYNFVDDSTWGPEPEPESEESVEEISETDVLRK